MTQCHLPPPPSPPPARLVREDGRPTDEPLTSVFQDILAIICGLLFVAFAFITIVGAEADSPQLKTEINCHE